MSFRCDHVSIALTGYIEFEGQRILRMDFVPGPEDRVLIDALLAKNDLLLLEQARAAAGLTKDILT